MNHILFYIKKLVTNFLTLPMRILYKSAIFIWYSDSISFVVSILSGAEEKICVILVTP